MEKELQIIKSPLNNHLITASKGYILEEDHLIRFDRFYIIELQIFNEEILNILRIS